MSLARKSGPFPESKDFPQEEITRFNLASLNCYREGHAVPSNEISLESYLHGITDTERSHLYKLFEDGLSSKLLTYGQIVALAVGTSTFPHSYWHGLERYLREHDPRKLHIAHRRGEDLDFVLCSADVSAGGFLCDIDTSDFGGGNEVWVAALLRAAEKLKWLYRIEDHKSANGTSYLTVPMEHRPEQGEGVIRNKAFAYGHLTIALYPPEARPFHFRISKENADLKLMEERCSGGTFSLVYDNRERSRFLTSMRAARQQQLLVFPSEAEYEPPLGHNDNRPLGEIVGCGAVPLAPFVQDLRERLRLESESRPERLQKLSAIVDALFPDDMLATLRADIKQSFHVPQLGKYHNEGVFMDTHLARILHTIEEIRRGRFIDDVPKQIRGVLTAAVREHSIDLCRYVFLHDIDKQTCATLHFASGESKEVAERELFSLVSVENVYSCEAALLEMREKGIIRIGYHQKNANRVHGPIAAERLKEANVFSTARPELLKAIEMHEIAYQFDSFRAAQFRRHFGSEELAAQELIIAASFIDLMGSLKETGEPDLTPFKKLIGARSNSRLIQQLEAMFTEADCARDYLDFHKVTAWLNKRLTENEVLPGAAVDYRSIIQEECCLMMYERAKFLAELDRLVGDDSITPEQRNHVVALLNQDESFFEATSLTPIRAELGANNRFIDEALTNCAIPKRTVVWNTLLALVAPSGKPIEHPF